MFSVVKDFVFSHLLIEYPPHFRYKFHSLEPVAGFSDLYVFAKYCVKQSDNFEWEFENEVFSIFTIFLFLNVFLSKIIESDSGPRN